MALGGFITSKYCLVAFVLCYFLIINKEQTTFCLLTTSTLSQSIWKGRVKMFCPACSCSGMTAKNNLPTPRGIYKAVLHLFSVGITYCTFGTRHPCPEESIFSNSSAGDKRESQAHGSEPHCSCARHVHQLTIYYHLHLRQHLFVFTWSGIIGYEYFGNSYHPGRSDSDTEC